MTLQRKAFNDIITFSRASNATVTGSDGLIQYAPHNLLLYSEQFDNAAWSKSNSTISANSFASPDGTVTADKLVENTVNSDHRINGTISVTVGLTYTTSLYLKAGERTQVALYSNLQGGTKKARIDLSNGTVVSSTMPSAPLVTSVGNGWYRVAYTQTADIASAISIYVVLVNDSGQEAYTGDGTSGIYIWGAQLSVGNRALSYTPTTSAAVYGPRFDYAPVSMAPKGLLIEEQRTNLLLNSDDFSTINWNKVRATVLPNVVAAPDGTVTADKLVSDTTAATTHYTQQAVTTTAASHTCTVYAKAGENNGIYVLNSTVSAGVYFDLATGAISSVVGSATGSITPAGNGWYRCSVTMTATAASNTFRLSIAQDGSGVIDGDGTSGIYLWGAQLEAGSFATSYIPTVASQVTRSVDVASVNTLSPWYNATEGTVYSEVLQLSNATASMSACLNDGTTANESYLRQISGTFQYNYVVGAVAQCVLTPISTSAQGVIYKIAGAYKTDSFAASGNGGTVVTDNAGSVTTFTKLSIGARADSTQPLNGHIRRIAYYPRRLTNSELQALTA